VRTAMSSHIGGQFLFANIVAQTPIMGISIISARMRRQIWMGWAVGLSRIVVDIGGACIVLLYS
jgi:hypothetical protein